MVLSVAMTTRWTRLFLPLGFALAALIGAPFAAFAQDEPEVSEETRTQARGIFGEGVTALDAGDCQTAIAKFRQAFDMVHQPSILYNLATAESECHDIVSAVEHYQAFVDQVRSGTAARYRPDARRQITAIRRRLGHLAIHAEGIQPDDDVHVDDRTIATTALEDVPVAAGDHVVVVRRGGAEWGRATATTTDGQRVTVDVTLTEPVVVPTPQETAIAASESEPDSNPLTEPQPNRRRRRIIIGSSVAGAVVIGVIVGVVVATH